MNIKPLKKTTGPNGGRPTRWRDSLPEEIHAHLDEGINPQTIINELGTSHKELKKWTVNKLNMPEAFNRLENELKKNDKKELENIEEDEGDYNQQLEKGVVEAMRTLRLVMRTGRNEGAKVQAAKELLDRAKGKPVQTTQVNQNVSYTIHAAIPAPPNSAALEAQAIEGDCETIDE